jgi:hypothetical protein
MSRRETPRDDIFDTLTQTGTSLADMTIHQIRQADLPMNDVLVRKSPDSDLPATLWEEMDDDSIVEDSHLVEGTYLPALFLATGAYHAWMRDTEDEEASLEKLSKAESE